jgi:hypothetical protein
MSIPEEAATVPELLPWPDPEVDLPLLHCHFDVLAAEEKIRKVRTTFHKLMLGEIERMLKAEEPIVVGAMMLICCAIDFQGTLFAGATATRKSFLGFVRSYLKQYEASMLLDLRNSMVHNYVLPQRVAFACSRDADEARALLASTKDKTLVIADELLADVARAGEQLFQDSRMNDALRLNILKRIGRPGLLRMYSGN